MTPSPAERYLRLGLQLGRQSEGIVDAYFGPPALAKAVDAEPPVEPQMLVSAADSLLAELEEGWLRDQVVGLRTYAGVLADESMSYADEVEGCYGVRPRHTDEATFMAAHERLEELLPGNEPLAARHQRWEDSMRVPIEQVERAMEAAIKEARAWTHGLVELPAGEGVVLEIVRDKPWWASADYLGDLRTRIRVNVDLPISAIDLLVLTLHEAYPGHHAERSCKEHLLVRGQGMVEESLVLGPTPQSLISEGIGQLAPEMVLDRDSGPALAAVVRGAGIELDLDHALAVRRALEPCRWAEVNAALMLHRDRATKADVQAYLERWALMSPKLAAHLIRFISEPTQRAYIVTYPAGRDLCRSYVAGQPERFRRLLTQQVRVRDLLEARDRASIRARAKSDGHAPVVETLRGGSDRG